MDFDYIVLPGIIFFAGVLIVGISIHRLRSLSTKSRKQKLVGRFVLSAILLITVAISGSSMYNAIAIQNFWSSHPPVGQFVRVNGLKMHINCIGSGSPTVILESELGSDSLEWGQVQPVISKTTRVCSYDRAGYGWSEVSSQARDADHIASELHQLLLQAHITGSLVLVGHSIGGLYIRDYAQRYPSDVAGMVFVDASSPLQDQNSKFNTGSSGPPSWLLRTAMIMGVPRLIGMCSGQQHGSDADYRRLRAESTCRLHYGVISAELQNFHLSSEEIIHSESYGALPILILSHDPADLLAKHHSAAKVVKQQEAWTRMQEDLKKLSTRSFRIVAKGSSHQVQMDRPELVEREVSLFIEQIRGTAPQPMAYGNTTIE